MPYLDAPDTVIAQLTSEARSILARVKAGDVVYRHLGWQLGRGGYEDEVTSSEAAYQTLTVTSFPSEGDTLTVGGAVFTALLSGANGSTQFNIGATLEETAENLKTVLNNNSTFGQYFTTQRTGVVLNLSCRIKGTIGNYITLASSGSWLTLGGATLIGGFGTIGANPVKVTPFIDLADHAKAIVQVTGLTFNAGYAIVINGKFFTYGVHWIAASTLEGTAQNIVDAIRDSRDPLVYRIATADLDEEDPTKIIISSYVTGDVSNSLSVRLWAAELETGTGGDVIDLELVSQAVGGRSTFLEDPAYPLPPSLASFVLPEGKLEQPDSTAVSFVCRVPDGVHGLNGYGELGIWAEVIQSNFSPEIGEYLVLDVTNDGDVLEFFVRYHKLKPNQPITFKTTGSLPEGVEPDTTYYVQNPSENYFQISLTPDGDPLTVSDSISNTGIHTLVTGIQRRFLFAHAHFPLQSKNDRMLLTYRIVVNF